jgi:hypothetical protein
MAPPIPPNTPPERLQHLRLAAAPEPEIIDGQKVEPEAFLIDGRTGQRLDDNGNAVKTD